MPLKILLADDSMTAQKMGKDILAAAGYEVIAVSNGAVAAKKLVDKPDIVILDVYMPGYTGLELCEKIRANADIARTPVLLTVGKMEPYKAEDGQRVKADGVIIKPFEASDLIAAVQKLEQKINQQNAPKEPDYEKTIVFKPPQVEEFKDDSYSEWKSDAQDAEPDEESKPAKVEMSHEMASSPAFGDDMMSESQAVPAGEPSAPAEASTMEVAPAPSGGFDFTPPPLPTFESSDSAAMSGFDISNQAAPEMAELTPVESQSLETLLERTSEPAPASLSSSRQTVEFTAAPSVGQVEVKQEAALQRVEVADERVIPTQDPALVTDATQIVHEFPTKFGVAEETLEAEQAPAVADADDFERRVAAAMTGYDTAEEVSPHVADNETTVAAESQRDPMLESSHEADAPAAVAMPVAEPELEVASQVPHYEDTQKIPAPVGAIDETAVVEPAAESSTGVPDADLVEQMQAAVAELPVEATPPQEEVAEVVASAPPAAEPEVVTASSETGQDMELANALAAAVGAASGSSTDNTAEAALDSHTATAVDRVLKRVMPTIMMELAKELEAAKKLDANKKR